MVGCSDTRKVVIRAVGDIQLADGYFDIGYGMGSQIAKHGVKFPFKYVSHLLREADLTIGNLECVIATKTPWSGIRAKEFLADVRVVDSLLYAGIDVMSVTNNHVMQHGSLAFRETVSLLRLNNIIPVGCIARGNSRQELILIRRKSINIGLLSFSLIQDMHNLNPKEYAYCYPVDVEKIVEEINVVSNLCDILIVLLHWGDEYSCIPSHEQRELAYNLIDNGVDIIIGHHPHVLQGVEIYKKKIIAYSLGNFVFNKSYKRCRQSAILEVTVSKDGQSTFNMIPVWINELGQPTLPSNVEVGNEIRCVMKDNDSLLKCSFDPIKYKKLKSREVRKYRASLKRAFLRNIHKMHFNIILQLIYEFLIRRIKRIGSPSC
jgi:poly-gamma-glutamate synthesis protein (capsule biosynthesis protein)